MPLPMLATGKALLGPPQGPLYLLYDAFNTALAAGAVNGTNSEPGAIALANSAGARTVTDTLSKLSIASGVLTFAATGSAAGNPGLWYPSQARLLGLTLVGSIILPATADRVEFGFDASAAGSILDNIRFGATTVLSVVVNGTAIVVGVYAAATYSVAMVMRSTGHWYFIKGGAFTNWTLIWVSAVTSAAGLPALVAETSALLALTADNIRIPLAIYIPQPLAFDTFTRANGALGSTETTGPDSQVLVAKTWNFTSGIWTISSNAAIATPNLGADAIVNGTFAADTDWTKGTGWSIAAGVAVPTAATSDLTATVAPLTVDKWYQITFALAGRSAGNLFAVVGTNVLSAQTGTATFTQYARADTTAFAMRGGSALTATSVDNVTAKVLTLSELFTSVTLSAQDVIVDAALTLPSATACRPAGIVVNLDSASTPANFVLAWLDGNGSAWLDKCVAGVYTNLIKAAVTYSAGAVLRVTKSGTSYRLFYNNLAVGAVQTVSDAGIVNNLNHGLFSVMSGSSLDTFTVWPTGTSNNEHGVLDQY